MNTLRISGLCTVCESGAAKLTPSRGGMLSNIPITKKSGVQPGPIGKQPEDYQELLDYLKRMQNDLEILADSKEKEESEEPTEQLKLFRVFVAASQRPETKYRKNGDLKKFALGGTLFVLGTNEDDLIVTLRLGILNEVDPARIGVGEHVGPFNHGHVISYDEIK